MHDFKTIPVLIDNELHFLFPTKCETSYYYYKHCDGTSYRFYDYSTYSIDYLDPKFRIKNIANNSDLNLQKQLEKLTKFLQYELKVNPIFITRIPSKSLELRQKDVDYDSENIIYI